jgi:hypothetical protein
MVFAAELTVVNEQRKPEAEAVLPRLSSHLLVIGDWGAATHKITVAVHIINSINRWPKLVLLNRCRWEHGNLTAVWA